jgi:hypothetical protein
LTPSLLSDNKEMIPCHLLPLLIHALWLSLPVLNMGLLHRFMKYSSMLLASLHVLPSVVPSKLSYVTWHSHIVLKMMPVLLHHPLLPVMTMKIVSQIY